MISPNLGIVVPYSLQLDFSLFHFSLIPCCAFSLDYFFPFLYSSVHRPIDWGHGTYLRLVYFFLFILPISFLLSRVAVVVAHGFLVFNISF